MKPPQIKTRQKIAIFVKSRLPWASICIGSKGYRFITINRGETISGLTDRSAWSRPVIGSRSFYWDNKCFDPPVITEELTPDLGEIGRMKIIHSFDDLGCASWEKTAADLVDICERWLTPVPVEEINKQLRTSEKFEHCVYFPPG